MNKFKRIFFLMSVILLPIVFTWWLFLPLALIYFYFTKSAYEILFVAIFLDELFFISNNVFIENIFLIFGLVLFVFSKIFGGMLNW